MPLGVPVACEVVDAPNVHHEILAQADRQQADLIVMGTHGRSGFQRLFLGSVTEKVLRTARPPVLTVGAAADVVPARDFSFKRILCAVDFSACSLAALRYAATLAETSGAKLTALYVMEWPPVAPDPLLGPPTDLTGYRMAAEAAGRERLHTVVAELPLIDHMGVEEIVAAGKPHHEILRVAAEREQRSDRSWHPRQESARTDDLRLDRRAGRATRDVPGLDRAERGPRGVSSGLAPRHPPRTRTRAPSLSVSGGCRTTVCPSDNPSRICPSRSLRWPSRAERLDCGQPANERVPPGHASHADGQRNRRHGRKRFGNSRDRQRDAGFDDKTPRRTLYRAQRGDDGGDREREPDQTMAERVEPTLERRALFRHRSDERADAAHLGGGARCHHHRASGPRPPRSCPCKAC